MNKNVAIFGYGTQGRAQALNLLASGWRVTVLLRPNSPSLRRAADDGVPTSTDPKKIIPQVDYLAMLMSDEAQADAWQQIADYFHPQLTVVFAHGFNLHYARITPPATIDVVLAAPMCPGDALRRHYLQDQSSVIITAVAQNISGAAEARLARYVDGITGGHAETIASSIAEETETNLFVEQALLIGGLSHLMQATYDAMVQTGYNPRLAQRWCLDDLRDCAALFAREGLAGAYRRISATAQHGGLTRGPRIITADVQRTLAQILQEVRNGTYTKELLAAPPTRDTTRFTLRPDDAQNPAPAAWHTGDPPAPRG